MEPETGNELEALRGRLAEAEAEVGRLRLRVEEEVRVQDRLIRISTLLNSTLNRQELLPLIMNSAKELLDAEVASIMLIDEETGDLVFEVSLGEKSEEVVKHRVPIGQGIAGHVAETGEPMIINSAKDDPYFYDRIDSQVGFETRNMLAVPLRLKAKIIGVVEVINLRNREKLGEKDLDLATVLTHFAAIAIENASLYQRLADALVVSRMSYRL